MAYYGEKNHIRVLVVNGGGKFGCEETGGRLRLKAMVAVGTNCVCVRVGIRVSFLHGGRDGCGG